MSGHWSSHLDVAEPELKIWSFDSERSHALFIITSDVIGVIQYHIELKFHSEAVVAEIEITISFKLWMLFRRLHFVPWVYRV